MEANNTVRRAATPLRIVPRSVEQRAAQLYGLAIDAALVGEEVELEALLAELADLPSDVVDGVVEGALLAVRAVLWSQGWQPAEVVRHPRRVTNPVLARLAATLLFADHLDRDPDGLHPPVGRAGRCAGGGDVRSVPGHR